MYAQDSDGQELNIPTAAVHTTFPIVMPRERINSKAVIDDRCRHPFQKYYAYYSTIIPIILAIILIISNVKIAIWVSIHCRNQPLLQEQKQHIITRWHSRPMCPVQWRMQRRKALQQRRFGSISANHRALLD